MCAVLADERQGATTYKNALDGLEALLRFSPALGRDVVECGGVDRLGELQQHENHTVYHGAVCLLEEFFDEDVMD